MNRVNFSDMPNYDPSLPYVEGPMPSPEEVEESRRVRRLGLFGIPARYHGVTASVKVPQQAENWAGDPWAVTILGPAGTGKTWIAVRLLIELANRGDGRDPHLVRPRFFDVATAMEAIKSEFGTNQNGDTLEAMMRCRLLVMDDLGAQRETDFTKDQVSVVLRSRYNDMLPTIITSNAANLGELGDQRIASRLSDGLVITLNGKDRRGRKP